MARLPKGVTKVSRADGRTRYHFSFSFEGKRYAIDRATAEQAAKDGERMRREMAQGVYVRNDSITLKDYAAEWLKRKGDAGSVKEKTLYCYRSELEKHVFPIAGKKKIQTIQRREIVSILIAIKNAAGAYTANYCKQVLFALFREAKRDGIRAANPCEDIPAFKDKSGKKPARETIHRALEGKEISMLFAAARNSAYYSFFRFLLATGLRMGEAAALKRGDIDFLKGIIHVRRTVTGDKNGRPVIGQTTKTKASERDIEMNEEIRSTLNGHFTFLRQLSGREMGADELVFKNTRGELITGCAANNVLRNIVHKIQKSGRDFPFIGVHALRHTFASRALVSGMRDNTLKEIMGHSSLHVTTDLYAHEYDETKREAMQRIVTYKESEG